MPRLCAFLLCSLSASLWSCGLSETLHHDESGRLSGVSGRQQDRKLIRAEASTGSSAVVADGTQPAEDTSWAATSGWLSVRHEKGESTISVEPKKIKLFCFAWTSGSPHEKKMLPEIQKQHSKCDGSAIFGDKEAPGPHDGVTLVEVPSQQMAPKSRQFRNDSMWLYHRNMAGIIPGWGHLLQNHDIDSYDWVINSEFDHFMRPTEVRQGIAEYFQSLWDGTKEERQTVGKPLMLAWGNAFLFNSDMVKEMRRQWDLLGKQMPPNHHASGCPDWLGPKHPWLANDCPQDDTYPMMANVMKPPVKMYGMSGCGQPAQNGKGKPFNKGGLACYQMDQSPLGGDGSLFVQLASFRAIASSSDKLLKQHKDKDGSPQQHGSLLESGDGRLTTRGLIHGHVVDGASETLQADTKGEADADGHLDREVGTGKDAEVEVNDIIGSAGGGFEEHEEAVYKGRVAGSHEGSHGELDMLGLDTELRAQVESIDAMILGMKGEDSYSRQLVGALRDLRGKCQDRLAGYSNAQWFTFWPEKSVPIIHNVKHAEVMALGRELLGL